jgi:predicted RNase H-like nuclease (RuvC/YqgF family)
MQIEEKKMSKIINAIIIGLLGGGCFTVGIYYATLEFENQVQIWDSNYQIVTDKVGAFEKVSDPKTVRLYVKELNKILDDVTFLGKIVESGQVSSESLDEFFSEYQDKIENVNGRLKRLYSEVTELEYKFKEQVTRLTGETDDNLELIDSLVGELDEQNKYVNQLNIKLGQSIQEVEDDVQTIKSSKYGKKIWIVKK